MGDKGDKQNCLVPRLSANDVKEDPFNPLNQLFTQMACILVMSHVFYLILKPLGQSGPIAQIFAGMVLSPGVLGQIKPIKDFFTKTSASSADYFPFIVFLFRTFIMFFIGLEMDLVYMRRNWRRACTIAAGGMICCALLAISFVWIIVNGLEIRDNRSTLIFIYVIILSNSASPVIYRVISDMKLNTSDIGRLAISSSLFTDIVFILIYTLGSSVKFKLDKDTKWFLLICLSTLALIIANLYLAPWFGTWYPKQKYMSKGQVLFFFVPILVLSTLNELHSINSAISIFLLGLMFPRKGKAYRTLLQLMRFPVHEFVLPIYFGYIGYRFSLPHQFSYEGEMKPRRSYLMEYLILTLTIVLCLVGKFIGTLVVCHHENIPWNHSIFISCLLSMKGHFDINLLDINHTMQTSGMKIVHDLLLTALVIVTLISGMVASWLFRKEERGFAHTQTNLEFHATEMELRILSCVYNPRNTVGAISLISVLSGTKQAPLTPLLVHLVELPKKKTSILKNHSEISNVDDYGGNDSVEINDLIDTFKEETKILIHQAKIVNSFSSMHEDLCNCVEDLRVSMLFLPFHKHQRIDGTLKNDGEGIKTTNQKVLRHSPCSVGIFMERGQTGFQQPHGTEIVQHVATLFFGGADDREALALSKWISAHAQVHLTLIQFSPTTLDEPSDIGRLSRSKDEILMSISNDNAEKERDITFLKDFHDRYVSSGEVGYVEKHVENGGQTVGILKEVGKMYSLIIVGRGSGNCPMTMGMSDWEECPELGAVGDILASSELDVTASLLVVQNHRHPHTESFLGG